MLLKNLPDTAKNNGFRPNRAEYEPKGKKPTTLCRSRWFATLSSKNSLFESLLDISKIRRFEENGAEYEPSGGTDRALSIQMALSPESQKHDFQISGILGCKIP